MNTLLIFSFFFTFFTFSLASYQWNWVGGFVSGNVPNSNSYPGARSSPLLWRDSKNNLWLFGGQGIDTNQQEAFLNDFWTSQNNGASWRLITGSQSKIGVYGSLGVVGSSFPGARTEAAHWIDTNDNLWIFGGYGFGNSSSVGYLNDVWKYNGNSWIWMGGSSTVNNVGNFGSIGQGSASNIPSARSSLGVFSSNQVAYIFGGNGVDSQGILADLNDLWSFDGKTWTWLTGGSVVGNTGGVYGNRGVPAQGNTPGGRFEHELWIDNNGNVWLFGGSTGNMTVQNSYSDIWVFGVSNSLWTWIAGPNVPNQQGSYLTQGQPNPLSFPTARSRHCIAADTMGNAWIFGGSYISDSEEQYFSDIWLFNISTFVWTWVAGSNAVNRQGNYGIFGEPSPLNNPGGRDEAVCWFNSNAYYFFGGFGTGVNSEEFFDDVWQLTNVLPPASSIASSSQAISSSNSPSVSPTISQGVNTLASNVLHIAVAALVIVVILFVVVVIVIILATFLYLNQWRKARNFIELQEKK